METTKISNVVYEQLPTQCKNKIEASFFSKSARKETRGSQLPKITNALLDELKLPLEVTFPLKSTAAEKTQALLVPNDARLRALKKKGTILRTELKLRTKLHTGLPYLYSDSPDSLQPVKKGEKT